MLMLMLRPPYVRDDQDDNYALHNAPDTLDDCHDDPVLIALYQRAAAARERLAEAEAGRV